MINFELFCNFADRLMIIITKIADMKKFFFLVFLAAVAQTSMAEQVTIQTKNTTMVLNVENGKQPQYVYFGNKLSDYDLAHLQAPRNGRMDAYPAYGMNCPAEAALAMRHADGNLSTELVVGGMETKDDILRIFLKDPVYPVSVALCYKAYEDEDMIETWTEITNGESKPVTLTQFASCSLPIRRGNACPGLLCTYRSRCQRQPDSGPPYPGSSWSCRWCSPRRRGRRA